MNRTIILSALAIASACTSAARPVASTAGSSNLPAGPEWKRGAVCYEVFVRSFKDSDGDGIGDLKGLIEKLDYINDANASSQRDLGARCIWLMPIAASPTYHGYDATDYYRVEHEYGTNDDFKRLVAEAHRRGIRVLVDMVLNHASNEHPYFKDALMNPASPYRSWFRFSATKPDTKGPWGQEVWHKSPVRDEYYYGVFWSGMPDLNYENPAVREEAKKIATFWLREMGADGFRLDAIPYLVEEGNNGMGTAGTHQMLREYSAHVRSVAPGAYTIGEVYDSTGAMLHYYPDQLDAHFAFDASDAILATVREGSAARLLPPFLRLQQALPAERWSPFLRNHDQPRTMTVLQGDVARAKVAATLLLTLPGLPYVYYGEEIGMSADKPDPRLRTPMHWTRGRAVGFTTGVPWEPLRPDSLTANVEAQEQDPGSLLNLHRRLIHLRAANSALGSGVLLPLTASNGAVAAYIRRDGGRAVLVVANVGQSPVSGITLASADSVLAAGEYGTRDVLSGSTGSPLRVGADGRVSSGAPLASLGAMESRIFELVRR